MGSLERSISLAPWGGPGGDYWSFKASCGINGIVIHQGDNIKSISFRDANGHHSGTFGGRGRNDFGEEKTIDIHWPSEYLTSITGSYGDHLGLLVIKSLSFNTNLTTYGPFGTASDTSFSIPMKDGVIVGFHGRSGCHLDALGIYVKPGDLEGSISFGQWGGPRGDPWSFKASNGINEIVIHHGDNIKSLSFRDTNGLHSETFGGKDPGDVPQEETIVINWPSEHLTSITGSYGTSARELVITSLSFITNRTTHGPFGNISGTSFSIPMEGSVIVGFHGRAGYYLDALGIYVKPGYLEGSISMGPWGGPGGNPWSFIASRGISEIVIHHGDNIKSLSFRDTNGLHSGTFGGKDPDDVPEEKTIDIDWPSEHLTSITGSYGTSARELVITSLSFITNRTTHGPFGNISGTSFSIPMEGSVIVGFHGRAGYYLDALGIYVKPVNSL